MIIKTVDQLKQYLVDGGDPDRISISQDPVPVKPKPVIYSGEGRHETSVYNHDGHYIYYSIKNGKYIVKERWYKK